MNSGRSREDFSGDRDHEWGEGPDDGEFYALPGGEPLRIYGNILPPDAPAELWLGPEAMDRLYRSPDGRIDLSTYLREHPE